MAIQMKRGRYATLDKSRLVSGELVVATDSDRNYVGVAKAPSEVIELATAQDIANLSKMHVTNGYMVFGDGWKRETSLPFATYGGCAVVFQDKIHYFGGNDNEKLHYSYDGIDWESKEIRTFYGNPRYLNDKAMYFKLPDENLLDEDKAFNPRNYGNNNISNK